MKEQDYIDKLLILLEESINKLDKNKKYAVAFSGGLDSSVVAKLMLNKKLDIQLYVIGTKDCHDIEQAKKAAKKLKIKLKIVKIKEKDIKREIKIVKSILGKNANPDSISFNLPLYFVAKNCKEKFIVCGQGADELFGGYNKYLKLSEKEAKKELEKDLANFMRKGKPENEKITLYFKKKLIFPYLDKKIIKFSKNIPYKLKINNETRKYLLRKAAEELDLGKKISYKDKKAAQYGTGIIWIIKKLAKKKKMHISRYVKNQ